ncbi:hypothetical protein RRG08_005123 [Elysia crispata]|uniref:Uncharacterized protein n=1 Tax=Elysia crispata TaxID=231223 RepID=A0AAE1DLM7_9GAST|nr:hypothetical protein RRG08_005123 [Elysia crispata]
MLQSHEETPLVPNAEYVTESSIAYQVIEVLNRCSSSTEDEVKRFLAEEHDFHSLQPPLSSLGLNRLHLLGYQKLEEYSTAEDGVKKSEEQYLGEGEKLGRDKKSNFSRFPSSVESAATRVVRMASEMLGPRGDERNGCREEWLAFCSNQGKKSLFSSDRSNRFNNLFQKASALLFHK